MRNRVFKMSAGWAAGCAGLVGLLAACSGKYYEVGHGDSAGMAGVVNGLAGASGGAFDGTAGAVAQGGAFNGTAGTNNGASGATLYGTYCGVQFPQVPEALPALPGPRVFEAVRLFVAGDDANAPRFMGDGKRSTVYEQAGQYAVDLLHYYSAQPSQSAPGMARFVSNWWPGTPSAELWSTFFGSSTLPALMTSDAALTGGSGILTDLAVLSQPSTLGTGITARGAFIAANLLCQPVPVPPLGIPALEPQRPGQTRSMRLAIAVAPPVCGACHARADDLGNSLEHFDNAGTFMALDNGVPIDSSGVYNIQPEQLLQFSDVNELAPELANTCEVTTCITQQLLDDSRKAAHLPALPEGDARSQTIARVASRFKRSGLQLPELVRAIAETNAVSR